MRSSQWFHLLWLSAMVTCGLCACKSANWFSSFDTEGLSTCGTDTEYITGFIRAAVGQKDFILRLEGAECCTRPAPWDKSESQTVFADWRSDFDNNNKWVICPNGYFLTGMFRSNTGNADDGGGLHNIEMGRCTKPADHPERHAYCYDEDIGQCFEKEGLCGCKSGYFVVGLFRGACDELKCLDKLRCCKLENEAEPLDELMKMQTRIMDITQEDMARLGHYLGFGYASGCGPAFVGEDFRRDGFTWVPDETLPCTGDKNGLRLNIIYGGWSFDMVNFTYGEPVRQDLNPEIVDSGILVNDDIAPAVKNITRSEKSIRSVTHTVTSQWKYRHELCASVSYTPPALTGGFGGSISYKFSYESSTTTKDIEKNEQTKIFTVSTQKTLAPNSASKWSLILRKSRIVMPYTATVLVKFYVDFDGFLRYNGGYYNPNTNYYYMYRGNKDEPKMKYRFGDAKTPFFTALKRESETRSLPWMWHDMQNVYPDAKDLINELTTENRYKFTLTGKFEDVIGQDVAIHWDAVKFDSTGKRSLDGQENESYKELEQVAQALPGDPPAPNPEPPKVDIEIGDSPIYERLPSTTE